MKALHFNRAKKSLCGRVLRRLLGEEKGAVAMEYIVIALLVAAAVVGLVMVFGGNLRNMFDKTNQTLNQSTVAGVKEVGEKNREEQGKLAAQNDTAVEAGNKLGGDFSADRQKATGGTTSN
ncbi:MAG: Flp family type IVb pilin [Lentisphaeria bacterium]|jgi:Flp pilus assembly pilin Flp|nr:Flp family type IVb pilin [Lentisphaeria bacterium]